MTGRTIGSCSLCGGDVVVPVVWLGVVPPTPTCSRCGAVAARPALPVVPMVPMRPQYPHAPAMWTAEPGPWWQRPVVICADGVQ